MDRRCVGRVGCGSTLCWSSWLWIDFVLVELAVDRRCVELTLCWKGWIDFLLDELKLFCVGRVGLKLYWMSSIDFVLDELKLFCVGRVGLKLYWMSSIDFVLDELLVDKFCVGRVGGGSTLCWSSWIDFMLN